MCFSDAHFDLQNTNQVQEVTFSFIPVLRKSMSKHAYSYEKWWLQEGWKLCTILINLASEKPI